MYCPDCGLMNRPRAKFCANCGFNLSGKNSGILAQGRKGSASGQMRRANVQPTSAHQGGGRTPAVPAKPAGSIRRKGSSRILSKLPAGSQPASSSPAPVKLTPSHSQTPQAVQIQEENFAPKILPVGSIIDNRYKIVQHIATGGMGAIYKGEDTRLNTMVAIKEMLDFFKNPDDRTYATQRFREEALILADLRHSNIPRVTDNFVCNNRYYLIMDFIDGKNTEQLIRENGGKGLPVERVIKWAVQVCDVLYYLHSRSPVIIYRDMKPSNIMIVEDDRVILIDFGIARHFTPRRPGTMIGTHGYAPPEQYKGNTEPRSDIYAFAATIHHLLSGNDPTAGVPFNFKPLSSYRSGISPQLEQVLQKALENRVENRFSTALAMKEAFIATPEFKKISQAHPGIPGTPVTPQQTAPSASNVGVSSQVSQKNPADTVFVHPEAKNYLLRAQEYANRGKYYSARKELEKSLRISPNYMEAHVLMGHIQIKMGNPAEAVKYLNQAVKISPDSATAHLYLGKAYARLGKAQESEREYRIASNLDPYITRDENESFLEKLIRSFLT
jgi:serine/threonine protein kinase